VDNNIKEAPTGCEGSLAVARGGREKREKEGKVEGMDREREAMEEYKG